MRSTLAIALLICITALGCAGAEIQELNSEPAVTVDRDSGLPILKFTIWLTWVPTPARFGYDFTWTTYVRDGSTLTELDSFTRMPGEYPGVSMLNLTSPEIVLESGNTYVATLEFTDAINGLMFERTFEYVAPAGLPTGIHLQGWDGTQGYDLGVLSDDVIEELAMYHAEVTADASKEASGVDLTEYLHASADVAPEYPAVILLIPTAGFTVRVGSSSRWGVLSVNQYLHVYRLETASDVDSFLAQIATYGRDFSGRVYLPTSTTGLGGAGSMFVDEAAWGLLAAAAAEQESRPGSP